MKKLGKLSLIAVALAGVAWLFWERSPSRPDRLAVEPVAQAPAPASLNRTDYWTAIRDLDFESADAASDSPERERFTAALRRVVEGEVSDAVAEFQVLLAEADEARIRQESEAALVRLLRSLSRWDDLAAVAPDDLDAAAYRHAPEERYHIPADPVRLRTRIGWLRVPRVSVILNGRDYEFAVDTGASATVITDEVAAECGITPAEKSRLEETSTSRQVEVWTALARELRLGDIRIENHPLAVVRKEDLDLGIVQFDGIIGWTVFQHLRVEIDYARGETILSRPETRRSGEARNLFWLGYPMVIFRSPGGVPLYFGLDTGARDTTLKPNMANKVDLGPVETGQGMTIGAGGGERSTRQRARGFAMLLGDRLFHFERITIREGVKDLAVLAPDGQLGGDVALEGRMIIDFPNGHFALDVPAGE